jgi:hypothetical protein
MGLVSGLVKGALLKKVIQRFTGSRRAPRRHV